MAMKLSIRQFDLPLQHPFTISRETITVQPAVIVELQEDGHRGFGEATANNYYGFTCASICAAIESVRTRVENYSLDDPTELWTDLHPLLADNPFAQCALDQAAHDLWGKRQGKSVHSLWGLNTDDCQ